MAKPTPNAARLDALLHAHGWRDRVHLVESAAHVQRTMQRVDAGELADARPHEVSILAAALGMTRQDLAGMFDADQQAG